MKRTIHACALAFSSLALLGSGLATPGVKRIGQAQSPEPAPGAVRLATYNALNLFDEHDDPALTGRNDDADEAKPSAQKQALADAIRAIDADVIGMQEIESLRALEEFVREYLPGEGYDHVVSIDVGHARGIENAVISRFPLSNARVWPGHLLGGTHPEKYGDKPNWHAGEPLRFRRSPLMVDVAVPPGAAENDEPYTFTLFVVHHKSGRYNDYWREAEAETIVELITGFQRDQPDRNIAVLGDFNAQPGEESVSIYRSELGMKHVLGHGDRDESGRLTHASSRAIDFILLNEAMSDEMVEGSAFVYATPLRPKDADWRTTAPPAGYASDHMPVVVDVRPSD